MWHTAALFLFADGFMDFIHLPNSKILKILKNLNHNVSEAGCASVLRWMEGENRRTPILLGPLDRARIHHMSCPVMEASSF
jgi:hypothetical protein